MMRMLVLAAAAVLIGMARLSGGEAPESDADASFDVEPPVLMQNRDDDAAPAAEAARVKEIDPARLEAELDRAKKRAVAAERLRKIGALSKVEVEQGALRVVRLEAELANARLGLAKEEVASQQNRSAAGEASRTDLAQAETLLANASQAAQIAAANLQSAELEAAEANLRRQQKLLAMGSARKSDVSRAAEKLAVLKTPKN